MPLYEGCGLSSLSGSRSEVLIVILGPSGLHASYGQDFNSCDLGSNSSIYKPNRVDDWFAKWSGWGYLLGCTTEVRLSAAIMGVRTTNGIAVARFSYNLPRGEIHAYGRNTPGFF